MATEKKKKAGATKSGSTVKSGSAGTRKSGGSTASKKAPQGKAPKKNRTPEPSAQPDDSFLRTEAMIILSFALAVLLFLSCFHLCGAVGDILRSVQLGLFGILGYVFPPLLFTGTCFLASNLGNRAAVRKLAASVVIYVSLCTAAQLFLGKGVIAGDGLLAFYRASAQNGTGGGLVGGAICTALQSLVGTAGTLVALLVCVIISAVCITERSFVGAVKKGGSTAYRHARDDMDRRREWKQERRMRDARVSGVDLGATDLSYGFPEGEQSEEKRTQDDVFTGSISPDPEEYEDEVPFDAEEEDGPALVGGLMATSSGQPESAMQRKPSAGPEGSVSRKSSIEPEVSISRMSSTEPSLTEPGTSFAEPDPFLMPEPSVRPEPVILSEPSALPESSVPEEPVNEIFMDADFPEKEKEEERPEPGIFATPEETKQVVTASGKILSIDTEALQKKLESRRREQVADNGERGVAADAGPVRVPSRASRSGEDDEPDVGREVRMQEEEPKKEYIFPPMGLLTRGNHIVGSKQQEEYKETAIKLQQTLRNFGVGVTVTNISCGPSVTRYELHPEQGVKVSKIVALSDDIKLSLAAADIRIEAPIPGKSAVGIEVPNKENNTVYLRELLESDAFQNHRSNLAFAVGKDIGGQVVVTDIAKMPHLLIAGATGSGKSVCINTIIMSIIYKAKPEDVKLIMVDPKVVELSVYNGIPHLLIPVVTDPKKASGALNWAVAEMTDRYKKFAAYNVRDLKGYNAKVESIRDIEDEKKPKKLPQIVIIIDELADLMMVSPGEVEDAICRLAQLARACGIHLVIATQRPSVNVITGLIKANVPSRIAFSVSSGVDSRTIIDMNGAEKLLGKGDMLFYPAGFPKPQRVQGALVSDTEVQRVVDFLTEQGLTGGSQADLERIESQMAAAPAAAGSAAKNSRDEYFGEAGRFIIEKEKASIGMLQRMFKIGFNRAARIMDQLAEAGVVGEEEGTKPRKVLMTSEEFEEFLTKEG